MQRLQQRARRVVRGGVARVRLRVDGLRLGGRRRGEALEPGGGEQQLDRVRLRGQPELDLSRGVETRRPWLTVARNAAIWWIPRCIYDNRSHFW